MSICQECRRKRAIGTFRWTPGILRPWERDERFDKPFTVSVCDDCRTELEKQSEVKEESNREARP